MDTATIIQIIEGIAFICAMIGLGAFAKLYLDGKKFIQMIKEFLADADKAKADGVITKEESDELTERLCQIIKQGKVVLDDVLKLKEELLALLAKKGVAGAKSPAMIKVPKGEGPGK
jgi:hypothetical protein